MRTEKNPIFRVQVVSWRSVQHLPDRTIPSQLANVCLQPPLQVVYTQYQAQHLLSRYVLSRTPSGNRNNQPTCNGWRVPTAEERPFLLLCLSALNKHGLGATAHIQRGSTSSTIYPLLTSIGSPCLTDTRVMRSVHLQAENRTPDFYDFGAVRQSLRALAPHLCHEDFPP